MVFLLLVTLPIVSHPLIVILHKVLLLVATGLQAGHPLVHGKASFQVGVDGLAEDVDFVEDVLVGVVGEAKALGLIDVGDEHGGEIALQAITLGKATGETPDADHLPAFQKVNHTTVNYIIQPTGTEQPACGPMPEAHHQGVVVAL